LFAYRRVIGRRYLWAPPCALAGGQWEMAAAFGCSLAIAAVLLVEVLTPVVAVAALQLFPLLIGMWLLSRSGAALVASSFAVQLIVSLGLEPPNRPLLLVVGGSAAAMAALVRLHARELGGVVASGVRLSHLTQRELQVARLAGQAYTAAEIGARLHISERTVETHLANTYLKLGISSRRELIRLAAQLESHEPDLPPRPAVLAPRSSRSNLLGRREQPGVATQRSRR
jgi:DNA-binding CsgD family transcriptional regulator